MQIRFDAASVLSGRTCLFLNMARADPSFKIERGRRLRLSRPPRVDLCGAAIIGHAMTAPGMQSVRLATALALACATPLRADPAPPAQGLAPHHLHWGHPPHRLFRNRVLYPPPPPMIIFGNGPEPYGAPPSFPSRFPPPQAPGLGIRPARPALPVPGFSQGMAITVVRILSENGGDGRLAPSPPIDRPREAAERLAACWSPPLPGKGETVEITLRFSFNKLGYVVGAPRVTYIKAATGFSAAEVRASIFAAIAACTPLPFTNSMAASAPGYPLAVRFIGKLAREKRGQD